MFPPRFRNTETCDFVVLFGEAHSRAGKFKVFSSELMLLSLKIINLKGSCFWLGENIEFYNENSNFGKTRFSLERVLNDQSLLMDLTGNTIN